MLMLMPLNAVKKILQKFENKISIEYSWSDLTTIPDGLPPLDWVVMNPPFHEGKKTDSDYRSKIH